MFYIVILEKKLIRLSRVLSRLLLIQCNLIQIISINAMRYFNNSCTGFCVIFPIHTVFKSVKIIIHEAESFNVY